MIIINEMTLEEYSNLKQELVYVNTLISQEFGKLESRWLERKMSNDNKTHSKDLHNLTNIYNYYNDLSNVVKKYIEFTE